jgi:hypothetical protein
MLRILREVSAKVNIVGEVWLILVLSIKIAVEASAKILAAKMQFDPGIYGKDLLGISLCPKLRSGHRR